MNMKRLLLVLAVHATLLPVLPAFGADQAARIPPPPASPGFPSFSGAVYVGGRQGISFVDTTTFAAGGPTHFETAYDVGRDTGVLIGYTFGPVLGGIAPRIELEGLMGNPGVSKHTVVQNGIDISPGKTDSFGELRSYTALLNGYLDFNLAGMAPVADMPILARVSPFIGAGVGVSEVTLRRQGISATGVLIDSSDTQLTWQVSAGLSYAAFDKTTVDIGFRHMRTPGLEFTARDGTTSKMDLVTNAVTVAIRRTF